MGKGEKLIMAVMTYVLIITFGGFLLMLSLGVLHSEIPEVPALSYASSMAVVCIASVVFPRGGNNGDH